MLWESEWFGLEGAFKDHLVQTPPVGWVIFHGLSALRSSLGNSVVGSAATRAFLANLGSHLSGDIWGHISQQGCRRGPGGTCRDSHRHHLIAHTLPPQASSTPSTAAVARATAGWCTGTSVTTARSRSQSGGAVTSRNAPSPCKSSLCGPRCSHSSWGGWFGVALGAFPAASQHKHCLKCLLLVHVPTLAGGWLRSGVPAAAPAGSWGCRRGRCSACSACRMAPTAPCTPNTARGSAPRRAGPAAACPAPHSGGQEPGPR